MAGPTWARRLRAGIAGLLRSRTLGPADPAAERRTPEQRILDTSRRYGDVLDASIRQDQAPAADEPTWVRRLDERLSVMPTLPGDGRSGRREPPG